MSPQGTARLIGVAILIFCVIIMASSGTYVVPPGFRGVEVTMGKVSPVFKPEGFGFKAPFASAVHPVSIRQQTAEDSAECYSSDLQQVKIQLRVLFRIPDSSVVKLFQEYYGEPFESLVSPRVQEAVKEVTAMQSAEQIVKNREQIKTQALQITRDKVGTFLVIEDIVIENITLTKELEHAIEAKMVQEQEAEKTKYVQQRAQIEADTAVIQAKGEAESIKIRGQSLRENPSYLDFKIIDKWDGYAPLVIGGGNNLVYSMQELQKLHESQNNAKSTTLSAPNAGRSGNGR